MKKLLLVGLLLSAVHTFAASWDGTKGSITISTVSDGTITVIAVSTSDLSVTKFDVTVRTGAGPIKVSTTMSIPRRLAIPPRIAGPSLAVFAIPEDQIVSVSVICTVVVEMESFN
jgi:hypothetical protein